MRHVVRNSVNNRRFTVLVLGGFAALALLLAALGIFGVVGYAVQRRTREMGIRIALGAAPRGIVGMVLRDSLRVVAVGALLGLGGAIALTRVIQGNRARDRGIHRGRRAATTPAPRPRSGSRGRALGTEVRARFRLSVGIRRCPRVRTAHASVRARRDFRLLGRRTATDSRRGSSLA